MIRLIETRGASALPPGRDAAGWHAALVAEIGQHLSPAHARILAWPGPAEGGATAWTADGVARNRYADLDAPGRRGLDAALGAILSDIRRLAESGVAPAVRAAWPALACVLDMGHVFAVDGAPVLAGWGQGDGGAIAGRLAALDDGVAWRATPRPRWGLYGAVLAGLALLALAAGLLLPSAYALYASAPAACIVVPGQLKALRDQAALEDRGAQLQTLLASLTDEVGRRQLLCPIAVAPAPPPPRPAPTPAAPPPAAPPPEPPPRRADLPREQWDRREVGMLEGCWNLTSSIRVGPTTGGGVPVRTWKQCFDGQGHGTQDMVLANGARCSGPLNATFDGSGRLHVTETQACRGQGLSMARSERVCRRTSDTEAHCAGRELEGSAPGHEYEATFHR